MNNEEAIEIIKFLIDRFMNIKELKHDAEAMQTVLNYIEELEKEKTVKESHIKIVSAYNEELRKELKDYRELTDKYEEEHRTTFKEWCNSLSNSIPKQKIRDKIEELEEEDLEIYDTDSEDLIIAKYEQRAVLDFAQQLLNDKEEK